MYKILIDNTLHKNVVSFYRSLLKSNPNNPKDKLIGLMGSIQSNSPLANEKIKYIKHIVTIILQVP